MSDDKKLWDGDVLGRKQSADYLTKFMQTRYQARPEDQGFVLAINAEWGYGKTFMLNKWKDDLILLNHPTVYFDAWKNDFTEEPLIAFISELDDSLRPQFNKIPVAERLLADVINSAEGVVNPALKAVGKGLLKKFTGIVVDEIQEAIEEARQDSEEPQQDKPTNDLSKDLTAVFNIELKTHKNRKYSIRNFTDKLTMLVETLIKEPNVQLPMFVFVDELDRCRPDYALQLLEGIKHLFGVPGVYFIVATNLYQLSESVKAVYGGGFRGQDYLKRFFDLEYGLPEPNNLDFSVHLFSGMSEEKYKALEVPLRHGQKKYKASEIFAKFSSSFGLGLRDQQRVFKIVEAATYSLDRNIHAPFLFFLAMLYYKSNVVFDRVMARQMLTDEYKEMMERIPQGPSKLNLTYVDSNRNFSEVEVGVAEIGACYLYLMKKEIRNLLREDHSGTGWQRPIIESVISDTYQAPDGVSQLLIKKYQYVICQAGGFIQS